MVEGSVQTVIIRHWAGGVHVEFHRVYLEAEETLRTGCAGILFQQI